jgi:AAA+ ATPase superfamily predicted ATPase
MVREILREELAGEYEKISSWWNRRGDEIDLLALGKNKGLAVEIKNKEVSIGEAMNLIEGLKEKLALVKDLPDKMMLGVAARKILGKEELEGKGVYVWDLDTFSGTNG